MPLPLVGSQDKGVMDEIIALMAWEFQRRDYIEPDLKNLFIRVRDKH